MSEHIPHRSDDSEPAASAAAPATERTGFVEFLHTEVAGAVVLLTATIVALVIVNSPLNPAYEALWQVEAGFFVGGLEFAQSLLHWVDDALMALFFFVVGLEIKREFLVGELSERRKAALPVLAAVGGMVVPAALYWAINAGGPGVNGWGVPVATDIAFALGVMALLGSRVPTGLKVFLTALAIADDIGAILVIGVFYSTDISLSLLVVAAVLLVVLWGFGRFGIDSPWPYAAVGVLVWAAVLGSGVHATIAGVLVAFMIPASAKIEPLEFTQRAKSWIEGIEESFVEGRHVLEDNSQQVACVAIRKDARLSVPPLQRMEFALHPFVTFAVLPLFALGNAGVRVVGSDAVGTMTSPIALGILLGLVVGKPLGIVAMSWLAVRSGLAQLPEGVRWAHIAGAGILGGVGFTMSLFVANLAFTEPSQVMTAKLAILIASLVAGVVGYIVLRVVPSSNAKEI